MNDSGKIQIQIQKSHFAFIILMTFVFLCVMSLRLCVKANDRIHLIQIFFSFKFDSLAAMISFDIYSACKFNVTDSNIDLAFIVVSIVVATVNEMMLKIKCHTYANIHKMLTMKIC